MSTLPVNLDDLLRARTVESSRLEFKVGLNSEQTLRQIVATIGAFANDLYNENGGYIILGVAEQDGVALFPVEGIPSETLDEIQKRIMGQCNRIEPEYYPAIYPVEFEGKHLLVLWCPAGEARPYRTPSVRGDDRNVAYHVRIGSETREVKPDNEVFNQLMQQTARIPFDARAANHLSFELISPTLVRKFLIDSRSALADDRSISDLELFQSLRIAKRVNGHVAPLHVALLMFTTEPEKYFPGARIEVVQFSDDAGGNLLEEKIFTGPLQEQIRSVLAYLDSLGSRIITKHANRAEASRYVAFPFAAMEEAIVNAVYHRSYDSKDTGAFEPVKVYLYPDRMEIISYPGPVPGIKPEHFGEGKRLPPVPHRNRMIGDFLKELRLAEGRNTGIPKILRTMQENGSPKPSFDFDEDRTYFRVVLPAHPRYVTLSIARESAHLWALGEREAALERVQTAVKMHPAVGELYAQLIEYQSVLRDISHVEHTIAIARQVPELMNKGAFWLAIAQAYITHNQSAKAINALTQFQAEVNPEINPVEIASLYRRAGDLQGAHRLFTAAKQDIWNDDRLLNEFADVKFKLAKNLLQKPRDSARSGESANRLFTESIELYRRTIQLSQDPIRKGWCWFRLAEVYNRLRYPVTEVEHAYTEALQALPQEPTVKEAFTRWQQNTADAS